MLAPILVPILLAYQAPAAAAACTGADPAITSVQPRLTSSGGDVNTYDIAVTVQNLGTMHQASNVLDSVAMYQNGEKVDQHGLQPLGPNRSQTVVFHVQRSTQAESGTTHLHFAVQFTQPRPPGNQDCNLSNGVASIDV